MLPKGVEGTSKAAKALKKPKKPNHQASVHERIVKEVTKFVQENVEKENPKDVVP